MERGSIQYHHLQCVFDHQGSPLVVAIHPVATHRDQFTGHGQTDLPQDMVVEMGRGQGGNGVLVGGHLLLQEANTLLQEVHVHLEPVVHLAKPIQKAATAPGLGTARSTPHTGDTRE